MRYSIWLCYFPVSRKLMYRTETASWHVFYKRAWVATLVQPWSYVLRPLLSTSLRQSPHCSLVRGMGWNYRLTHWGRDKMAAVSKTTFSNAFSWMEMHEFHLRFHWRLSLRFWINNIPALVQIMAWGRSGDKPLSEPMIVNLLSHVRITCAQWVKDLKEFHSVNKHEKWNIIFGIISDKNVTNG